jgi:dipeptidyl aminopeptidase/acylaminoacyl peptidase
MASRVLVGGAVLALSPVAAAPPPLIPIEELLANPAGTGAQVSPDGRWLSYLRPYEGKLNVWVRPLPRGPERPVTRDTARPIGDTYRWSADSRRILYLQDRGGDENYRLYAVAVDDETASPRELTPFPNVETELIATPAATPEAVLVTLNRRNPSLADAYRLDLRSGAADLVAENPGSFIGYVSDLRGRVRAALALDASGHYQLHARGDELSPWRLVRAYPIEDEIKPLAFHPDGRRLYMKSNHDSDLARLVLVDLASGTESVVEADPLGKVDLDRALFDEHTGALIATRYVGDRPRWHAVSAVVAKALAATRRAREGAVNLSSWSRNQQLWVATVEAANDPGASYLVEASTGRTELLSDVRPRLDRRRLADAQPIEYAARDGLRITGYLTVPPGLPPRGLPLLLLVHGGPWERDVWGFDAEVQLYANRGYAVLQVNYRGSTGFGKRFARAAQKQFARAMQTDLLDAVAWAVRSGVADPKRVAIMGGSYGGYATLVALTATPERFACGVDYAGPANLVTLIEAFPPSWGPFLPRRWYPFVGNPADSGDRRDLLDRSPLTRVDAVQVPVLIFQGANDPRVTRAQSDAIASALVRKGIPVTYLVAGNEGHSFGHRETSLAVNRATEVFLGQCLGGRVQPTVAPEITEAIEAMMVRPQALGSSPRPDLEH